MVFPDLPDLPAGAVLEQALLTTYDLDMEELRKFPYFCDAPEKYIVFRGEGELKGFDQEDPFTGGKSFRPVDVILPRDRSGRPSGFMHAKIWLFVYVCPGGEYIYQLVVTSANISSYDDLEIHAAFSGRRADEKQTANGPLTDLLGKLREYMPAENAEDDLRRERLEELIRDLGFVRFVPEEKWSCADWSFVMPDRSVKELIGGDFDELLVISPFVYHEELSSLTANTRKGASCIVVTHMEAIRELLARGPVNARFIPWDDSLKYLHAKAYLRSSGGRWDIFAGSMNLTTNSMGSNLEFMFHFEDPDQVTSLTGFLSGSTGMSKDRISRYLRDADDMLGPSDSPLFRQAASYRLKQEYLAEVIRRGTVPKDKVDEFADWVLSSDCSADMACMLHDNELPAVPVRKIIRSDKKQRHTYTLPFRDRHLLAILNRSLHDLDGAQSSCVYSHIQGRTRSSAMTRIREHDGLDRLWLLRADIHDYDASVDADILSEAVHGLPGADDSLCRFLDRIIFRRSYLEDGILMTDGPAVMTGNPLCGFFENAYIRDVDLAMERESVFYLRYVDDMLIGAESEESLKKLAAKLEEGLSEKKISLNKKKTFIIKPGSTFTYLGWQVRGNDIDFTPQTLAAIERAIRYETKRLLIECKRRGIEPEFRLMLMISHSEIMIRRFGLTAAFGTLSVPDGLRKIDRMLCDMIRIVASGKTGKGRYRITYEQMQDMGYRSLVNRYYRKLSGKHTG